MNQLKKIFTNMKAKFTCLKPGDTIWVVYNENHKECNCVNPYNIKEVLRSATVLQNKKITVERISMDRDDDTTWTEVTNHIEIETGLSKYNRNYDDYYDKKSKMTITPEIWPNGPTLEVFVNKEYAIEYLEKICKNRIEEFKEKIINCQKQIELCEQSIINAKNYE